MSAPKNGLVHQFKQINEKRAQKAKERKAKGPVDIKEVRAQVKEWNKDNRRP